MNLQHLAGDCTLRPFGLEDAAAMHALIVCNREHLDRWLRWSSGIQSLEDARQLIGAFRMKLQKGDGFHCGIWVGEHLAGGVVCWYINRQNRNAEVGYWLGEEFVGQGLASRATRSVLSHLFEEENLHRVEMQCGVENSGSRAIPERLGFTFEGIRRDSHWITNRFVDHAIYSMLGREWEEEDQALSAVDNP